MPKKAKHKRGTARKTAPPPARTRASRSRAGDADALTQSLVAHGQAARPGPDGKLPAGATHELVEDAEGQVKAVRRRFSAL